MKAVFLSAFVVLVIVTFKNSYAAKHLVLIGRPGYGKTSSAIKIVELLNDARIPVEGYITLPVVKGVSSRIGFELVNCKTKKKAQFAHIAYTYTGAPAIRPIFGQYVIDVNAFDSIAKPIFEAVLGNSVIVLVMDEMGRMECVSPYYMQAITEVLQKDNIIILATSPSIASFLTSFANMTTIDDRFSFLPITRENRSSTPYDVSRMLIETYKAKLNGSMIRQ